MTSYSSYLKAKGFSQNTVDSYTRAVIQFEQRVSRIDDRALLEHKEWLMASFSARTANARIAALNAYLDFVGYEGLRLKGVRIQQKPYLENVVSNEEYRTIVQGLREDENLFWFVLIRFMACTGARVSELRQITIEQVEQGHSDLITKGSKLRRIYIAKPIQSEALHWCELECREGGALFAGDNGVVISSRGIALGLKRIAKRYGVREEVVYPHSFRHLFAKNFIARNPDIALLSDLMGHESIETTRVYLRMTAQEQRDAVNAAVVW